MKKESKPRYLTREQFVVHLDMPNVQIDSAEVNGKPYALLIVPRSAPHGPKLYDLDPQHVADLLHDGAIEFVSGRSLARGVLRPS